MKIDLSVFGGLTPKLGRHMLPSQGASIAKNCRLGSGMMRPLGAMRQDHALPAGTLSMFRWKNGQWFHHTDKGRHYVPGPVFGESQRLYMSKGSGGLVVWSRETGDVALGCPEPTAVPKAAVSGNADEKTTKESRVYLYTCVDILGQESAPSPPSAAVDVQGHAVVISGMATPDAEGYAAIVKKRIYRLATGDKSTDYLYVAEIDAASTSYTDSLSDAGLGEVLPTQGWHVPRPDLKGLCSVPGSSLAAFRRQEVRFSKPGYPYAWPEEYAYSVEYDIVGIACSGTYLFVFTTGPVYYMSCEDLTAAVPVRMEGDTPCLAEQCITEIPGGVLFPSRDGLYFVGSGYSRPMNVTEGLFGLSEWLHLEPSSMIGAYCGGTFYAWYKGSDGVPGGMIFEFGNAGPQVQYLTSTDIRADMLSVVADGQNLFIAGDGYCWEWEGQIGEKMIAEWQSRSFLLGNKTNFSAAIVEQSIDDDQAEDRESKKSTAYDDYLADKGGIGGGLAMLPVSETGMGLAAVDLAVLLVISGGKDVMEFFLFADGKNVFRKNIYDREPFCLPSGFTARTWVVRVRSNRDIRRVAVAESMEELYDG